MKRIILPGSVALLALVLAAPAFAQKPGTPYSSPSPVQVHQVVEPVPTGAPGTPAPLVRVMWDKGVDAVKMGYLILLEVRINAADPLTWRNVVVFSVYTAPDCAYYTTEIVLVSRAVGETGISNADLSVVDHAYGPPITTDTIVGLMGTGCVSILTNQPDGSNVYTAGSAEYDIYTNPDQVTPVSSSSWGRIKMIYR